MLWQLVSGIAFYEAVKTCELVQNDEYEIIVERILQLPTVELQYEAYQQITALLTGTAWDEKAAEVLETMFAKVKEQQDRQEQKQDKMIRTVKEAANKPTTQNILNLELVNKKETNIDKNYGPNIEHNGGTLTLPDKY